ncbi:amyloid-beta A4 precursor protein-binding family A member 3 isoform X2 [Ascaphus truei]|uniref:amyloid-beta A4 precursor protein-binding family A member 3 isoform X2 n=1 Tax=Ascaphus truei TaxID=8439 RepID=UPI003F5A7E4E
MENGMDFQTQLIPPSSSTSCPLGALPYPPEMDLETTEPGSPPGSCLTETREGSAGACQHSPPSPECPKVPDTAGRAPPRVDSCPEMDTRPPDASEMMGMEMDALLDIIVPVGTFHMQELLSQLPTLDHQPGQGELCQSSASPCQETSIIGEGPQEGQTECHPCPLHIATGKGLARTLRRVSEPGTVPSNSHGLFLLDAGTENLLSLLQYEGVALVEGGTGTPLARLEAVPRNEPPGFCPPQDADGGSPGFGIGETPSSPSSEMSREDSSCSLAEVSEAAWGETQQCPTQDSDEETLEASPRYPMLPDVPGPCEPEDLLDGVMFGAKYLGSTQLQSDKNPSPSTRMTQAQEAMDRVKAPDGESQPMTEVDVMVSTRRVKVLTADTQEALMDHPLQTISYIADIGSVVVLMARRKSPRSQDRPPTQRKQYRMLCHVFHSADAQMIAQAIGQAFGLAYQNFLRSEGAEHAGTERARGQDQLYNADLAHFSKSDNCREVCIQKQRGEVLGVAVVESGWGSLLPTVVIANLMHGGPAERSGELSIGDHVTCVNGTSLVGLPLATSQGLIRELKGQSEVSLSIVRCPPVTTAIIQRPSVTHQLGFCVEDGVRRSKSFGFIAI